MATSVAIPTAAQAFNPAALFASVPELPSCASQTGPATIDLADYMPMVRAIARRIHRTLPRHIELDDVISAGYLGLVDAAAKFDEARQAHFRGYAEFRVRGAILDSLRDLDWGTRSLRRRMREIEQVRKVMLAATGQSPDDTELAVELGISVADLRETLASARLLETESLQAEREDAEAQDLLATLADPSAKDALSLTLEAEFREALVGAIESLPERDRLIVTLSYYEELTLKEIGTLLNITVSRVSQLRSAAVLRLRQALREAR